MTPESKKRFLAPDTIWERLYRGEVERVYVESIISKLLQDGSGYVDFRTQFGLKTLRKEKFLAQFNFVGWANLRLSEIASDKNLKPFLGESLKW